MTTEMHQGSAEPWIESLRRETRRVMQRALSHRRPIALVTGSAVVFSFLFTLLPSATYTSTFSIIPQQRRSAQSAAIASFAAQFGFATQAAEASLNPQFYSEAATSRTVLLAIRDTLIRTPVTDSSLGPLQRWALDRWLQRLHRPDEKVLVQLRGIFVADVGPRTGVIAYRVHSPSAVLSRLIANTALLEMSKLVIRLRQEQAAKDRIFLAARRDSARLDLRRYEDSVQAFLDQNRAAATQSAVLRFQLERLTRDLTLRQVLYQSLAQSYEDARIDEVRNTPYFSVIDAPNLPGLPDSRRVVEFGLLAAAIALAGYLFLFVGVDEQGGPRD